MQTKGTVISISGTYAEVEVRRRVMCDGCPNDPNNPESCGHACAMGSLLGDKKNMTVRVKNSAGAQCGDTVILESPDRTVLLSAFLFFILPLVFAAIGFAIASAFSGSEGVRWGCALAAFLFAYVFAAIAERRARKSDALIIMKEVTRYPDKNVRN